MGTCNGRRCNTARWGTRGMAQARGRHLTHLQWAEMQHGTLGHTGYGSGTGAAPHTPAMGGDAARHAGAHGVWLRHGGGTSHTCNGRRCSTTRWDTRGMAQARGRHLTHLQWAEMQHDTLGHTGYGSGTGAAPHTPAM